MNYKKKIIIILLVIVPLVLLFDKQYKKVKLEEIDFDGLTISYNSKQYKVYPILALNPNYIDKKIGRIKANDLMVYSIKNQSLDQWLAIEVEDSILVYKQVSVNLINLDNFEISRVMWIDPIGMKTLSESDNQTLIKSISHLRNTEEVIMPSSISSSRIIRLVSKAYESFYLDLTYVQDEKGQSYIFDNLHQPVYKVGDVLETEIREYLAN